MKAAAIIASAIKDIRVQQKQAEDCLAKAKEAQENVAHLSAGLRELIRAGETTGDAALDYVIGHSGAIDDKEVERYRTINAALKDQTGQFVVVHYYKRDTVRHVLVPSGGNQNEYEWNPQFRCGVLSSDALVFPKGHDGHASVPMLQYLGRSLRHHKPYLSEGALSEGYPIWRLAFAELKDVPGREEFRGRHTSGGRDHDASPPCLLLVGDKVVREYFESFWQEPELFEVCAEMLGQLVLKTE